MASIDNLAVLPRPRSAWQAMDAGFSLARAHYTRLLLIWLAISLPMFMLSHLLLFSYPQWAIVVWWWLKPLYELPLLIYLSRALFGDRPSALECLKEIRSHGWTLCKTYLSLSRFSLFRSMTASVVFLERLPRRERRSRIQLLSAVPTRSYMLMVVCVHIEALLTYGLVVLVFAMMPPTVSTDIDWTGMFLGEVSEPGWLITLSSATLLLASGLVAPFYVAGGFLLYINRRMQLEGWDIEHRFRAIRRNHRKGRHAIVASLSLPVLALACMLATGMPAIAASSGSNVNPGDIRTQISDIHNGAEFGRTENRRVLKWIDREEIEDDEVTAEDLTSLSRLFAFIASAFELILWIAAGLFVLLLLFALRAHLPSASARVSRAAPARNTERVMSHPLTAGLPNDIPAAANQKLAEGDNRGALSLLYQGALRALMTQYQLSLPRGATENECEQLIASDATSEQLATFKSLVSQWQQAAYAHSVQNRETIQMLIIRWADTFASPNVPAVEVKP